MRALRGLAATDWPGAAEASGLEPAVLDRPAATLSRGMLQRVALLEALHAGCPLLLLDEPFAGLDDDGGAWLAEQLAERLDGGAAVLLTDHSGAAAGRLALTGALRLRDGTAAAALPRAAAARLTIRAVHRDGRRLERTVAEAEGDDLLRALLAAGWHVLEVRR
jgi:ABC-type multidrug transport system ATPase subunit